LAILLWTSKAMAAATRISTAMIIEMTSSMSEKPRSAVRTGRRARVGRMVVAQ
jgi:hypothetical protein